MGECVYSLLLRDVFDLNSFHGNTLFLVCWRLLHGFELVFILQWLDTHLVDRCLVTSDAGLLPCRGTEWNLRESLRWIQQSLCSITICYSFQLLLAFSTLRWSWITWTFVTFHSLKMVDVIHTDSGVLGAEIPTGTVDFWPNGGVNQPGCPIPKELCDHSRSWQFFAESVATREPSFDAIKCDSYESFTNRNCSLETPLNNMGIDASPKFFSPSLPSWLQA